MLFLQSLIFFLAFRAVEPRNLNENSGIDYPPVDYLPNWPMFNQTCTYGKNKDLHPFVQEICMMVKIGKLRQNNIDSQFAKEALKHSLQTRERLLQDDEYDVIYKAIGIDIKHQNPVARVLEYACKQIQKRIDERKKLRAQAAHEIELLLISV